MSTSFSESDESWYKSTHDSFGCPLPSWVAARAADDAADEAKAKARAAARSLEDVKRLGGEITTARADALIAALRTAQAASAAALVAAQAAETAWRAYDSFRVPHSEVVT